MKLGFSTLMYGGLDLYGACQHVSWAGYDGVELACLETHARHIELNTNKSYIDEIKATVKKHGLELLSIHTVARDQSDEDKLKYMTKMFEVAQKVGSPVVTIRSEGKSDDKEATQQEFKLFKKLSERAESRGVTLAIKPHVESSVYNIATVMQMLDAVPSPGLGVNLDIMHLYLAGDDPSEGVRKFGKRIVHAHFRDCPHRDLSKFTPESIIPGRGVMDIPKILKSLKNIGYDKAIDVDVTWATTYPLSRQMGLCAEARGYLHRCLQELKVDIKR